MGLTVSGCVQSGQSVSHSSSQTHSGPGYNCLIEHPPGLTSPITYHLSRSPDLEEMENISAR